MAAYLKTLDLEPGSRIGILSRTCAWWVMAAIFASRMNMKRQPWPGADR